MVLSGKVNSSEYVICNIYFILLLYVGFKEKYMILLKYTHSVLLTVEFKLGHRWMQEFKHLVL